MKIKKIILSISLFLSFVYSYDEIEFTAEQSKKIGIGLGQIDFSGYHLIGPLIATLDFSNQSSIKQISPFEVTISRVEKFSGEYVKKGEVICFITGEQISNLIYEYNNVKTKLDIAKNNMFYDTKLYNEGVISKREFQNTYILTNDLELRFQNLDSIINQMGISPVIGEFGYKVFARDNGIIALSPNKSGEKILAFSPYVIIAKNNNMFANIKIPLLYSKDVDLDSKIYIKKQAQTIEIGKIESVGVGLDSATNTIFATAMLKSTNLKAGSNIDIFIMSKNPNNSAFIPFDVVTKFGNDNIVFVKTKSGFLPTKINIIKEVNNGFLISRDDFNSSTFLANGSIIILKGVMSGLSFE